MPGHLLISSILIVSLSIEPHICDHFFTPMSNIESDEWIKKIENVSRLKPPGIRFFLCLQT